MGLTIVSLLKASVAAIAIFGNSAWSYPGELPDNTTTKFFKRQLPTDHWQRKVSNRCTAAQELAERVGWAEAGILANALHNWKPGGKHQNVMDYYMGAASRKTKPDPNLQERVQNNINRQFKIHSGEPPKHTFVYTYCDEQDAPSDWLDECKQQYGKRSCCRPETLAYSWDSIGWLWNNHMVVLCPSYFESLTLSEQVRRLNARWREDPSVAYNIFNMYLNQGETYLHESFHWRNTVSQPRIIDVDNVYGPEDVAALAREGTDKPTINADSYTIAATAAFMVETYELLDVPKPYNDGPAAAVPPRRNPRVNLGNRSVPSIWFGLLPGSPPRTEQKNFHTVQGAALNLERDYSSKT
ncbi:hypothetical protein TWF730_010219 [Orbilia blumenaviensis]|uniref:Uncharacterized protein n=1 Tax=Orbilia blumenaviensis TaxID=1796055 RepID=A0AAV9UTX4_9PEZI